MLRLGQMPVLTLLFFGVGLGGGLAWKTGCIPIEVGAARTGQLEEDAAPRRATSEEGTSEARPAPEIVFEERSVDDPAIFEQQQEPTPDTLEQREVGSAGITAAPIIASHEGRSENSDFDSNELRHRQTGTRPSSVRTVSEIQQATHRELVEPASTLNSAETALAQELKEIDEQVAAGETLAAHRALSKLYWNHKEHRTALLPRLDASAKAIFFQPQPHFVDPYVIQPNDQLRVIANKYHLSWEYLARLNKTEPRRIRVDQKLKVVKGPFAAVVDLEDFALTIHLQGYFVKRYQVGIGKDGSSPVGKFAVLNKIENPQYTGPDGRVISSDDPSNPLGERWLDLGDSYGIHGTIDPESIGKAASRGCIRLRDNDVIEVYDFLVKDSEVVIRN
jgi:LysM repeat protein